jgi:hypothetical protein
MLVDQESLWFKVLVAKYGLEDGRVMGGGGKASWWWKDMCGVREGVRLSVGRWFEITFVERRVMGKIHLF